MIKNRTHIILYGLVLLLLSTFTSCKNSSDKNNNTSSKIESEASLSSSTYFSTIKKRGVLNVATNYNTTNYFIYRGTPMGYHYDRVRRFAASQNLKINIIPENDIHKSFSLLKNNRVDLLAFDLTVSQKRKKIISFTDPIYQSTQVLIQRKPDNWRKISTYEKLEKKLLRNTLELAQETIYVQQNTSFESRLTNLMDEIGDTIFVKPSELSVEELIKLVNEKKIKYTVADEHVAKVNRRYYPNIDIKTPVSFPQNISWAVNKNSDSLRTVINNWQASFDNSYYSNTLYNKYFKDPRMANYIKSNYHSLTGNNISKYDSIIKINAEKIGWDWRLFASMIYQESNFSPKAKSWMGAYGLMQMMPKTMASYGIDASSSPQQQIEAGCKYILWLDKQFKDKIIDTDERKKYVLAAYNVGIAHIYDAMRLTIKYGGDPLVWDKNVSFYLRKKSQPKYYNDSVVYYGYARGEEPVNYVSEIFDRYQQYRNIIEKK
ncbi:MAG: transporter substrate-binding domain-containing protein [Bacteroidota bacterium]|nr:transporter substrate-binding domain-containing protein [Bacteroidota bacterium]